MSKEYEQAYRKYNELAKAAAGGNEAAKADKAKAYQEVRAIERSAARSGTILKPVQKTPTGPVTIEAKEASSKKSLQEEYARRFDDKAQVVLNDQKTTLRQYHAKRLGVRV